MGESQPSPNPFSRRPGGRLLPNSLPDANKDSAEEEAAGDRSYPLFVLSLNAQTLGNISNGLTCPTVNTRSCSEEEQKEVVMVVAEDGGEGQGTGRGKGNKEKRRGEHYA